jgi:hypothetical protein
MSLDLRSEAVENRKAPVVWTEAFFGTASIIAGGEELIGPPYLFDG